MNAAPATRAFAPATVANLGPGFDILGAALEGPGDAVTARLSDEPGARLVSQTGVVVGGDPARNTAVIAAKAVLAACRSERGVELSLEKGLPIGSGLGSSAASAAAAALAVSVLLGSPLDERALILCALEAEAKVSGRHADNVAPALLGGIVLVRSLEPLEVVRLPVPAALTFAVVTPQITLLTRDARAVLPAQISLPEHTRGTAQVAGLVTALHSGDLGLLSRCLDDALVTPARLPLIRGGRSALDAAREAGALGGSISGSGPSLFAVCDSRESAQRCRDAMITAFEAAGVAASGVVSSADCSGARVHE
ncbi:MAG: homoserine kinase [Planctomycetota bacterium]